MFEFAISILLALGFVSQDTAYQMSQDELKSIYRSGIDEISHRYPDVDHDEMIIIDWDETHQE